MFCFSNFHNLIFIVILVRPQIIEQPTDIKMSQAELYQADSADYGNADQQPPDYESVTPFFLHCGARGYNPDLPVLWVKDDSFYLDNGPAPQGLTLYLDYNLVERMSMGYSLAQLHGRWRCEVWGLNPKEKVTSEAASVELTGDLAMHGSGVTGVCNRRFWPCFMNCLVIALERFQISCGSWAL